MRKGLIVLFSVGTVLGFGSGFARLAHRGSCHERWSQRYDHGPERYGSGRYDRYDRYDRFDRAAPAAAPAPAPAAAPQAAPVYIVVPSAPAAAPVIVNNAPAPAQAAPIVNVAPAPVAAQ